MNSPTTSPARRGRPGGLAGRDLLDVARGLFLTTGYAATTMEVVAAAARISKQTLYRTHPSKDHLLAAVVRDWMEQGRDAMRPHLDGLLATGDDVEAGLLGLADALQAGVLSPPVLAMRHLVISEAERLPDLASDYVTGSWDRKLGLLADALEGLARRGLLTIDSSQVAAQQLTWLVLGAPLDRLTLTAGTASTTKAALGAHAREAVTTFLARYGT